jgi:recombination protein RecA
MPRQRINRDGGLYFSSPHTDIQFIPTGSRLLDRALGGGWAQSRVANIVGDRSTGKTLLAIEAAANFSRLYPQGRNDIGYRESEHAFLPDYARTLGMPLERLDNWDARRGELTHRYTMIEDMFDDLSDVIAKQKQKQAGRKQPPPYLHITDSLDALSDEAEQARDIRKGTYGAKKPKILSELFRRLCGPLEQANITLLIINQVRSKIGMHFGRDVERTGGRALDFYASQAIYLADIGKEKRTVRGQDRITGVNILAKVDKNKISQSYRAVEFPILFGYGIDDVRSCLNWLYEIKALKDFQFKDQTKAGITKYLTKFEGYTKEQRDEEVDELHLLIDKHWFAIERELAPKRRKYE